MPARVPRTVTTFGVRPARAKRRANQKPMLRQLTERLVPFEEMLIYKPFLLDERPRFVDFDLFGMLDNFLYSGHYRLPAAHTNLRKWHSRMSNVKITSLAREKKLHS